MAQVVSPEQLGVARGVMAVILLAMWGVTTALSPLSAVTMFASRMAEVPPVTLAWRWNLPAALIATAIITLAGIVIDQVLSP